MSTFDSCVEPDEDGTEFVAEVRCCRHPQTVQSTSGGVQSCEVYQDSAQSVAEVG